MSNFTSHIAKERFNAEKYMLSNGWVKLEDLPFWKDPISNKLCWFNDAWDIQYERDKTRHNGG